jgi:hypothetical protein
LLDKALLLIDIWEAIPYKLGGAVIVVDFANQKHLVAANNWKKG